jgi:predicted P-loop ATPase
MKNVDFIKKLAKTVKTNDDKLFYKFLRKWLVATVACAIEPDVINQTCLILIGRQGIKKTRFLVYLCPEDLKEYLYIGMLDPSDKDSMLHMSECFLILLDEIENMGHKASITLKEIITKPSIRIRRPYGYNAEKLVHRASFMGSANTDQLLSDPTGSRRFLCFMVEKIGNYEKININSVWKQAYDLYKKGFKFWISENDIKEINQMNEQFQILSIEEELLLKFFEPVTKDDAIVFKSATDILADIRGHSSLNINDNASAMKLGKALKKHGFVRLKKQDRYVWAVKELYVFESIKK